MTTLSAALKMADASKTNIVAASLVKAGFQVDTLSDEILLLIADSSVFSRYFKVDIQPRRSGAAAVTHNGQSPFLPLDELMPELADAIEEVELESAIDFGPSNF